MRSARGGCLETVGVIVFALLLGAFTASTWLRHRVGGDDGGQAGVVDSVAIARRSVDRSRIRIEVRNGSGLEGAAGRMTEFLRAQGFDVVDFGNADRYDHRRTFVVDRGGGLHAVGEVAFALQGVPIDATGDSSPYLDVTVVVGRDVDSLLAHRERDAPGWRRWFDKLPWR